MAYAANWTAGHGLVPQPGAPAVEGYSNFLWVCLLAGLNLAGGMNPEAIKFVSFGLVGMSLFSLNSTCKALMPDTARFAVLLLVATNSSIVTWTSSGLENALTLVLACELLRMVVQPTPQRSIYTGVIAGALALDRPEGAIYALLPLVTVRERKFLGPYIAVAAAICVGFLAFRVATFGDWLPNTYYAKAASSLRPFNVLLLTNDLLAGPFGLAPVMLALFLLAYPQARTDNQLWPPLAFMALAGGTFVLMPPDWMPDRRFATAFVPAAYLFAAIVVSRLGRWTNALLAGLVCLSIGFSFYRLAEIYRSPTVPMAGVQRTSDSFNQRARQMGLSHASVLMPDLGAALLTSNIRVYDLAGLTDKVIGRTLNRDEGRFHDYVFEDIKPTFIKTHGFWAERADFDSDPRFRRDYVPIAEAPDDWLLQRGVHLMSGEYIRRDVMPGQETASCLGTASKRASCDASLAQPARKG
jgi:hypothetical protein